MKTNNVSFFVGENTQRNRQELMPFTGKKENSNTFFAAALNGKADPIALKKQMAQKKALKVVGDAFAADRKLDAEVADREARIKEMRAENLEAKLALKDLDAQKIEVGKEYGLGEEDLNILKKGKETPILLSPIAIN